MDMPQGAGLARLQALLHQAKRELKTIAGPAAVDQGWEPHALDRTPSDVRLETLLFHAAVQLGDKDVLSSLEIGEDAGSDPAVRSPLQGAVVTDVSSASGSLSTEPLVAELRTKLQNGHMLGRDELAQLEHADAEAAEAAEAAVSELRTKLQNGHMLSRDELAQLEHADAEAAEIAETSLSLEATHTPSTAQHSAAHAVGTLSPARARRAASLTQSDAAGTSSTVESAPAPTTMPFTAAASGSSFATASCASAASDAETAIASLCPSTAQPTVHSSPLETNGATLSLGAPNASSRSRAPNQVEWGRSQPPLTVARQAAVLARLPSSPASPRAAPLVSDAFATPMVGTLLREYEAMKRKWDWKRVDEPAAPQYPPRRRQGRQ